MADEVYAWAWIDEDAGTIRARSFADGVGIPEDEATGSAALALSAQLGRADHRPPGQGSVLIARPLEDGRAEVGGRVALDEERDYRGSSLRFSRLGGARLQVQRRGHAPLGERALRRQRAELAGDLGAVDVGLVVDQQAVLDRDHVAALDVDRGAVRLHALEARRCR